MDTDSFIVQLKTENAYEMFKQDLILEIML